ncbi:SAM-dependent methyltransferase [Deferribacter autotrophicus]|uniref:SAM-dependent methyltransferase n=1 Tax=Deferribacter autotrophicus TaxID=500465 RepID=A0A5A8F839_9BACT|nr:SAM-dependent methyltransferase [Deferribacter autotrophicus]KAA0259388.1 SAM-dependent methyltransferase [Deferribacter autotrophicus]
MDVLKEFVIQLVKEKGKITFAEFMEIALYHPEYGYYQKENPFGMQGSFYTSVDASESFGRTLAKGFEETIKELNLAPILCEMGAGSGMLANDILNYYKAESNKFYSEVKYIIIEKSKYLIDRQKELLKEHIDKVEWISFDGLNDFEGVFFSNELVDAFPVHRIININGDLKELYVIYHDEKLQFYPDEFSTVNLKEYIGKLGVKLVDKQIADINLDAVKWIKDVGEKINKGIVVTIDYGFDAKNLYAPFRMDGTVTCYFKHTQNNDFFERIGYQDITAFVDFSALMEYGKESGLNVVNFEPQWVFLLQSGILDEIRNAKTDLHRTRIKSLIIPEGGFGTNFNVLIQSKGVYIPDTFLYNKKPYDIFEQLSEMYAE